MYPVDDAGGGALPPVAIPPAAAGRLRRRQFGGLQWGGRKFNDPAQFQKWLLARGGNMQQFKRLHPHAMRLLRGTATRPQGGGAPAELYDQADPMSPAQPGPPGAPLPPGAGGNLTDVPNYYPAQLADDWDRGGAAALEGGNRRFSDAEDNYEMLRRMPAGLLGKMRQQKKDPAQVAMLRMARKYMAKRNLLRAQPGIGAGGIGYPRGGVGGPVMF